jgi:hypothetical protein
VISGLLLCRKPLESFATLPEETYLQVVMKLAVLNSHTHVPQMDVFIFKVEGNTSSTQYSGTCKPSKGRNGMCDRTTLLLLAIRACLLGIQRCRR